MSIENKSQLPQKVYKCKSMNLKTTEEPVGDLQNYCTYAIIIGNFIKLVIIFTAFNTLF